MAGVIIVLLISGVIALRNFRELQENRLRVRRSHQVLAILGGAEAAVMDAESSQRGFLITGSDSYLAPFDASVKQARQLLDECASLTLDNPVQQAAVPKLRALVDERIAELRSVLAIRVNEGAEAAKQAVFDSAGNRSLDRIRVQLSAMRQVENDLLKLREGKASYSYQSGQTTSILSTITGLILVAGVMFLLERNRHKAERAARELRSTRERLQLALDAAGMGSWNIDPATRQLMGDQQFRKIFGFEQGDISYQRALEALYPEDRNMVEAAIAASTRPDNPAPYSIEYRVVHADGAVRWVLAKGASRFTGVGKQRRVSSFNGTVQDITVRKQQEQRLLESEQAALAANRSKSEFLANMSHEIRTPMAAILGYADVLLGHLKDPDNRNCVLVMKRNGKHLLELINDILDLSRIEAGKLEIDLEVVLLPRLVADLQSLMQVRAEEKQLDFRAEFVSRVPDKILTDPTRLRQVLINLIGNAIKFTESGSVVLAISYRPSENGQEAGSEVSQQAQNQHAQTWPTSAIHGVLQFSVRDTGIGVSEEQQRRLFKPFSQGDSSVTRSYGGSGLGLAISKRLMDLLGGDIVLHSRLGEGATFTVILPIALDDSARLVQPDLLAHQPELESAETEHRKLTCRVLVVDDRRDVRHISQHFLEKAGAQVLTAEDGEQGIEMALASRDALQPFDLIVMDMQMPNVDGLQATARLRSANIQWPIIALTADAMKGDRDRCLNGGCDDYLSKPIDHVKLVSLVARYTQDISVEVLQQRRASRTARLKDDLQHGS